MLSHLHKEDSKAIVCPKEGHQYPVSMRQIEASYNKQRYVENQTNHITKVSGSDSGGDFTA